MSPLGYRFEAYCPVCETLHVAKTVGLKLDLGSVEIANEPEAVKQGAAPTRTVPVIVCVGCRQRRPGDVARAVAAMNKNRNQAADGDAAPAILGNLPRDLR